jgi:hypothetical protein
MAKSDTSAIPRLCKYRSMEEGKAREHTLAILKTLELRYSPASTFNDPFDYNLDIALKTTADVEAMVEQTVERGRAAVAGAVSHVMRALSERLGQEDVKVPPPAVEESRAEPERRTPSKLKLTIRTPDASEGLVLRPRCLRTDPQSTHAAARRGAAPRSLAHYIRGCAVGRAA